MKNRTGICLRALALLLVLAICSALAVPTLFTLKALAAPSGYNTFYITNEDGKVVNYIGQGDIVNIEFNMLVDSTDLPISDISVDKDNFSINTYWGKANETKLSLVVGDKIDEKYNVTVTLTNVQYKNNERKRTLRLWGIKDWSDKVIQFDLSETFFTRSSSDTSTDEENPYTSRILIDRVYIRDANGDVIDKVDKDSKPFTIEVIFVDRGLREVDADELNEEESAAYLTSYAGFNPAGGSKGTLKKMIGSQDGAPRFRAVFNHMEFKGGGNTISFNVEYAIYGWYVEGESGNVVVPQAGDEEDKDKLKPLTPHIIVNQYSYGDETIAAGESFTLNMTVRNTSADIPLENVVMTITPETIKSDTAGSTTGGLTIASSSNTYYIERLAAGGTLEHSIDLRAEPNAAVGSHKVEVKFSFQYVDDVNEARETGTDSESIAIPVTQIDRFEVDPLTDYSDFIMLGEEGYITVSFINKGKSTTYNVTGIITSDNMVNPGQSVHYSEGNLQAGKSGSLEFSVQPLEAGQMTGTITIQYEDDNTNQKEIAFPFTITVDEPYIPPFQPPGGMEDPGMAEQPGGPTAMNIVLNILGGLCLAVPLMLYIIKWVKAKGSEEFDEVF